MMTAFQHLKLATLLIAYFALLTGAGAQNSLQKPAPAATDACPTARQLKPVQIHGLWRVRFSPAPAGLPAEATLQIERHAEFSDSVAGFVSRDLKPVAGGHAARAQLAGDLEDGFLSLDESSNGVSITGTWNAEMVEGSCGKQFKGTWKDTRDNAPPDAAELAFTLDKLQRW